MAVASATRWRVLNGFHFFINAARNFNRQAQCNIMEKLVFVLVVVVKRAIGDIGVCRDIADSSPFVAPISKDADSAVQ